MKKTLYYTNLLDSVLFQNKYSGHGKTTIAVKSFCGNDSYKDIVNCLKEQYKNTQEYKKDSTSSYSSGEVSSNDYYEEFSCAHIIPALLQIQKIKNKTDDAAIVLSLNQVADNHAVTSDLGEYSGLEDIVKTFCNFFKNDKFKVSTYKNKLNDDKHSILSYIYYSLISALHRINSSNNDHVDVGFISSLFHNLGGTAFKNQPKNNKNSILISELCQYDEVKKLLKDCRYKEEEAMISEFDKTFEKIIKEKKDELNLGYITTIKFILKYGKMPSQKQQNSSYYKLYDIMSSNERESKITFFDIIESLFKLENASKEKYVDNIPDIFSLTYESDNPDVLSIQKTDKIFTKALKAFLNNKNLFIDRIDMFMPAFKKNDSFTDAENDQFLTAMKEAIFKYVKNMALTINGARSNFVTPLIEIRNAKRTRTDSNYAKSEAKRTELKNQLNEVDIINKFIDSEKEYIAECLIQNIDKIQKRKEANKTPTNLVKSTIITTTINVILELLIYAYNACYAILTADGRMFEADGTLKLSHNQYVMNITEIHERTYRIQDGVLTYEEGGKML